MKSLIKLFAMLCLSAACWGAQAQGCTVSATAVAFGTYNPQSSSNVDNTGTVTVTCQATVALLVGYTVKLSAGNSASFAQRKMLNGTTALNYQIYDNSSRTTVWGDGSSSTVYISDGYLLSILTPVVKTYTAYGRITGSQNVIAGAYTDTLTVLITY